ncbi:DUF4836 family protein [Winogradskyella marincola]|uniref:DUF4836 family protein n=1 Tax=Winogradskyella marincola TaxID=3037795 RepID=A0ABT6G3I5_9FLAO|nr:DUF4836 family protein [Winogradskyella sp. YYF002]MDG4716553.1 DUF4836 family protein [Winogradskyella sp. YYF002]
MKLLPINQQLKTIIYSLVLVLFASCSSRPESLKAIPENTSAIAVVDVFSLYKKGNLEDLDDLEFFKTFQKEIRNEDKKVANFLEDLREDPSKTGVDFTKDVFMYYIDEGTDEKFVCVSLDLKDEEKYAEFLEDIFDKGGVDFDVEKEDLYKYIKVQNEVVFAWDSNKALIVTAQNWSSRENLELEVESLFELKVDKQIVVNKEFMSFYSNKKDVNFWVSSNILESSFYLKELEKQFDVDMTDNYISASLEFEDDRISLQGKMFPNREVREMMKRDNVWDHDFNNALLKFLPKQSFANLAMSFNPSENYKVMQEQGELESIEKEFEKEMGFELEDLIKSIEGSMVFSLSNIEESTYTYDTYKMVYNENKTRRFDASTNEYYYEGGYEYRDTTETRTKTLPVMSLVFDINSDKYLKKVIKKIPESEIEEKDDYYEVKLDGSYSGYFAFDDDTFLFTNDKKSIKAFKDGGLGSKSLSGSSKLSDFSGGGYYAYLNLNYDDYPKEVKKMIEEEQNDKEEEVFEIWTNFARGIELKMIDNFTLEFNLETKDNGKNSLQQLLELMDESFKSFSSL